MKKYFVWISTMTGPQAQIWYGEPVSGNGKPQLNVLSKIAIEDGMLSLDQLIEKYPCPETS